MNNIKENVITKFQIIHTKALTRQLERREILRKFLKPTKKRKSLTSFLHYKPFKNHFQVYN